MLWMIWWLAYCLTVWTRVERMCSEVTASLHLLQQMLFFPFEKKNPSIARKNSICSLYKSIIERPMFLDIKSVLVLLKICRFQKCITHFWVTQNCYLFIFLTLWCSEDTHFTLRRPFLSPVVNCPHEALEGLPRGELCCSYVTEKTS